MGFVLLKVKSEAGLRKDGRYCRAPAACVRRPAENTMAFRAPRQDRHTIQAYNKAPGLPNAFIPNAFNHQPSIWFQRSGLPVAKEWGTYNCNGVRVLQYFQRDGLVNSHV